MSSSHTIEFIALEKLFLDPRNPRLGGARSDPSATQEHLMEHMRTWSLEELAVSFIENGFWPQEAVIVVKEKLYGQLDTLVVVEGNRRIAALKYLKEAVAGKPVSRTWRQLAEGVQPDDDLFTSVPYILVDSREKVTAFIGFRHVTGVKEWPPAEKAEFIARMVDEQGMPYESIGKKIGNRPDTIRRNYIAYRILRQIDDLEIDISEQGLENRFSVLFLSLREKNIRTFLGVDLKAEPKEAQTPIPEENINNLSDFVTWLFGSKDSKPLFTDSRNVRDFAHILSDDQVVEYLRSVPEPDFDLALKKSGIENEEIENQIKEATNQIELALMRVHLYLDSEPIQKAMRRLALSARELMSKFPDIAKKIGMRRGVDDDA